MNRQIIPSMILSVLIVSFFSIVLHEREEPEAIARPPADATRAATTASASRDHDKTVVTASGTSKVLDRSKAVGRGPQPESRRLARTETASVSTGEQHPQGIPVGDRGKAKPVPSTEAPAIASATTREGHVLGSAPIHQVTRSVGPVPLSKQKLSSQSPGSSASRTAPSSSFTTVKDGETLEDVTIRIYGSSDPLDLLWRANRDILPHKNSQLSPGTVLRTPEV
jgi:hypothetical protein